MADAERKFRNKSDNNSVIKQHSHFVRKRVPTVTVKGTGTNDIYITNKSDYKSQLAKCGKLMNESEDIVLHGLGAAIPRTINLALNVHEKYQETYKLHVETSTVTLVDDLEPLIDSEDYETQTRQSSAITINIEKIKTNPVNQL